MPEQKPIYFSFRLERKIINLKNFNPSKLRALLEKTRKWAFRTNTIETFFKSRIKPKRGETFFTSVLPGNPLQPIGFINVNHFSTERPVINVSSPSKTPKSTFFDNCFKINPVALTGKNGTENASVNVIYIINLASNPFNIKP